MRYDNWKIVFMEQRCQGTMEVWAEPFTRLRLPKIFNLRTDPYEFADITSNTYYDWFLHHAYFIYAAQAGAAKFAETFKEFPPVQKPNTFTIDDAMAKMSEAAAGGAELTAAVLAHRWNDRRRREVGTIVDFVARVTTAGGPDYVPPAERIATFDNDGTLWCEQPLQVQFFFLIDRVRQLAAKDPSLTRAPAVQGLPRAGLDDAACARQAGAIELRSRPMPA